MAQIAEDALKDILARKIKADWAKAKARFAKLTSKEVPIKAQQTAGGKV